MSPHRSRFVTASQQLLALGVVLAALVPATGVVSLDVVAVQPRPAHHAAHGAGRAEQTGKAVRTLSELVAHPLGGRDRSTARW